MKRVVILSVVALIALSFVACNKPEVEQYKGTYKGTYTFVKENGRTQDGSVVVVVNPLKENSIGLYGVINLDNVSEGVYESTSENVQVITSILSLIGVNIGETTEETIKNIKIKCNFNGSTLNMDIVYEVELFGIATVDIRAITFVGTKKTK